MTEKTTTTASRYLMSNELMNSDITCHCQFCYHFRPMKVFESETYAKRTYKTKILSNDSVRYGLLFTINVIM